MHMMMLYAHMNYSAAIIFLYASHVESIVLLNRVVTRVHHLQFCRCSTGMQSWTRISMRYIVERHIIGQPELLRRIRRGL